MEKTPRSRSTDATNAYSPNFELELSRRGVRLVQENDKQSPVDFESFRRSIRGCRTSPEPEAQEVHQIRLRADKSRNEATLVQSVLPKILQIDAVYDSNDIETVPDQQWDKKVSLPLQEEEAEHHNYRSATVRLASPKPDQTVGLSCAASDLVQFYAARSHLGSYCTPVMGDGYLLFPCFTAECKGAQGSLKVSRLQNAHNAAVMLHCMLNLRRAASSEPDDYEDEGNDDGFFNRIRAITISLSTESVEICYHWAESNPSRKHSASRNGSIAFLSKPFGTWSLNSASDFLEARRCVRNALDWIVARTSQSVKVQLRRLEQRLKDDVPLMSQCSDLDSMTARHRPKSQTPSPIRRSSRKLTRPSSPYDLSSNKQRRRHRP